MFSSFFSTSPPVDPTAPTLHPVSSRYAPTELFGELEPKDTEWLCASGFVTETQVFYVVAEDGMSIFCQVIHSSIGVWYPTIQFTCKIYNPRTKETIWRSVNVSNWSVGADKRSSKADEYSITLSSTPGADHPETYTIRANLPEELQILLEVRRPSAVPGFKVGKGPKGGYSYFGHDPEKADGYAVHRFWPRTENTGMLVYKGEVFNVKGPGMFIHAIQGMRPDNVAAAWDFANFQSDAHGGVSAMQMEFKTIDAYGRKGAGSGGVKVNVGAVVLGGKLAAVTAETRWPDEALAEDAVVKSRVQHLNPVLDPDTGYGQPTALAYEWAGPSIVADAPGAIEAKLVNEVGTPSAPNGLIDKVDVLAEIPQVIKMVVNYVSGTKPFMYMFKNPGKLVVKGPDSLIPGLSEGLEIEGAIYNETTFIST